jgi:hypothetical protein
VVLKLSTEDLRVSSTALGDWDLSSSSCAPCLRVNIFYLLLPLALASHSAWSCYCMSRSRVRSILSRDRLFRVSSFDHLVLVPWHPCILKVGRDKLVES